MQLQDAVGEYFGLLKGRLAEREIRLVAGALAKVLPRGGITLVSQSSDLSRPTIYDGIREIEASAEPCKATRQRRAGAGRKSIVAKDGDLVAALRSLISPHEHGDPESPLLWVSKSLRKLSSELKAQGHNIGYVTVGKVLQSMGYTLQSNKKSHEGGDCPDRDEQFGFIAKAAELFFADEQPVISVDAKKKELIGNFKNNGREYHEKGNPELVEVYDFVNENGRATPYGVFDVGANEGYVNVGTTHDTAAFAVDTISLWWKEMGFPRYPGAHSLMITADGGGSNGSRNRLWKTSLQDFANKTGLTVCVCHFPPGTSKWNKIEHRMFSAISMNWRGKPLTTVEIIVNLIANTTTLSGLKIKASKSDKVYECGQKVSDDQMLALRILKADFHPEWNYAIRPAT
jgi:hypothetical protein